jgi:KDO2-lipid IV(A) lauroyltransferase
MTMELDKFGIKLAAIYRPLNNFFINPFMEYFRMKYICPIQIPKGVAGSREIIKKIKDGYSIAIMVDQRVSEGPRISFFNKEAHTTTIPAQIALKYNCKLVPIYIERKNGINFEMVIHKPYEITKTGVHEEDLKNNSLTINQNIEKMIIKNPTQWIWTHNRWK